MLIHNLTAEHIYLTCGYTDMRKSIDGLVALVAACFLLDPHQTALFLFCGRKKRPD
ncbi:IS66 family insertion sequence element accessory protein TnpB [Acidaminococcus massiliensis]|uniref:IS66 family insertion sequence element accessory protein TnpB n=1 Tax=Acidaminococcus massiliensis TaxID=1852375 RepID=UPI0022E1CAEC|nr:IS66 family insertion sequence element accessory protein TnpB [Acidaminococcus massiliensis]